MAKPFKADVQNTSIVDGSNNCVELFTKLFNPYSSRLDVSGFSFFDEDSLYIAYKIILSNSIYLYLDDRHVRKDWLIILYYKNKDGVNISNNVYIEDDFAEIISKIYDIINKRIQSAESIDKKEYYEGLLKEMNLI